MMLRTPDEAIRYLMDIATMLAGFDKTLPAHSNLRLIVKNNAGAEVTVYVAKKSESSRYEVFTLKNSGKSMGPLEPGQPIQAEVSGGQVTSGSAKEVADEIRRFLERN
jgi:hypothetical protein